MLPVMHSDALSPLEREYDAALTMLRAARHTRPDTATDVEELRWLAPIVDHCATTAREAGVRPERMLIDIKQALGLLRAGTASAHERARTTMTASG
jgi:hypothetical protein